MSALLPWIAVIVTVLAGWALIKRYQTHMVLLFAGLVILIFVALMGGTGFLPKGVKPSGFCKRPRRPAFGLQGFFRKYGEIILCQK